MAVYSVKTKALTQECILIDHTKTVSYYWAITASDSVFFSQFTKLEPVFNMGGGGLPTIERLHALNTLTLMKTDYF